MQSSCRSTSELVECEESSFMILVPPFREDLEFKDPSENEEGKDQLIELLPSHIKGDVGLDLNLGGV
uniref:Uncharacterized protein n=1 Tax=Lepeophtheirus salmonis TaxID=72036 RepID=A0A0K2V1S0_LEPSM